MVNFCVLASISLVIGICGIVTVSLLYALTGGEVALDHGVVVDAGSSHSQITLYKWLGEKKRDTGQVQQKSTCYSNGGLAKVDVPEKAGIMLTSCLNNISTFLTSQEMTETPLFLGATAGFRLLNESDYYHSEALLIQLRLTFSEFGFNPEKVRIISGEEEGLYGWITANFLAGNLRSSSATSTVGALDLGGASTQIAFTANQNESFHLRLYGSDYSVVAQSALCFGADEIFRRHLTFLITNFTTTELISDPCSPLNYTFNATAKELFDQPCTATVASRSFLCQKNNQDTVYNFIGSSNSSQCSEIVQTLLNFSQCSQSYSPEHCFSEPQSVPVENKFYAFSSFYYTASFLNSTNTSLAHFKNESEVLCAMAWDEVKNLPTKSPKVLPRFCFQALYIMTMLTDVYKFNSSTWENILFEYQLNGTDVGWSLGYMINATNSIPAEVPSKRSIAREPFIILLIFFTLLLGLGTYFTWRKLKTPPTDISYIQV